MNILITGATGFLGFNLATRLAADGHDIVACARRATEWQQRIPAWRWIPCDFTRDTTPNAWRARLVGVDLVINAVGIIAEGKQTFAQVQTDAPRALFQAASDAGMKVIQVSAMGADQPGISVPFLRSKQLADEFLLALPGECIVLYPSIVLGRGGTSTALFNQLAALPVTPLVGNGEQKLNPIHIDDLCDAVAHMVAHWPGGKQRHQLTGSTVLTMRELYAMLRDWLRLGRARFVAIPMPLMKRMAALGDRLGLRGLASRDALELLEKAPTPANTYTAALPRPLAESLWRQPAAPADTWYALMATIRPAMFVAVLFIWFFTALTSAFFDLPAGYALMKAGGVEGPLATAAIYGGAAFDFLLGMLMLLGWQRRRVYSLQIGLMLGYMVGISFLIPETWLHPFGPVTKNFPMLVATWMLMALEPRPGERYLKTA